MTSHNGSGHHFQSILKHVLGKIVYLVLGSPPDVAKEQLGWGQGEVGVRLEWNQSCKIGRKRVVCEIANPIPKPNCVVCEIAICDFCENWESRSDAIRKFFLTRSFLLNFRCFSNFVCEIAHPSQKSDCVVAIRNFAIIAIFAIHFETLGEIFTWCWSKFRSSRGKNEE